MKQILFICLLGIGTLLPTTEAKSNITNVFKKVDVHVVTGVLYSTSQSTDGIINHVEIYDSGMSLVAYQMGNSTYSCTVDLSDLNPGLYTAKVYCTNTTHTECFTY